MFNDREQLQAFGRRRPAITPAHLPAVLLGALLIMALVLGVVLGDIGPQTFHQPTPSPSDPITVP